MAKLRKPIEVEAEASDERKVVVEQADIVGGIRLADMEKNAAEAPTLPDIAVAEEAKEAETDGEKIAEKQDEKSTKSRRQKKEKSPKQKKEKKVKEKKPREKKIRENTESGNGGRKLLLILVCVAVVIGLLSLWIAYDNNRLEKDFYQVKSSKVTDNIRIVAISDLHNREFGEDNERLVYEISKLSPDVITLVGDMIMEKEPDNYKGALSLCRQLGEVAPVYFSLGNHELDAMLFGGSQIYKDAKKQGIKILNNEVEKIEINGTPIDVIGLTQNPLEFEEYGKEFLDKAMEADDNFKLLLNHYPEQFLGVLDDYEIDLAIAGHAHGGQVRLPWIGGLYSADQGFLPQLCDGYHEIGNSKLVITRGLGKSGWCPRINNTPEIMVIDLGWY